MSFDHTPRDPIVTGTHLRRVASAGIATIDRRLEELERECPGERVLRWTAAAVTVLGLILAAAVSPWLLVIPALSGLLFVELCCRGCSLLSPLLCRYGVRSTADIQRERTELETLRGDFSTLPAVEG